MAQSTYSEMMPQTTWGFRTVNPGDVVKSNQTLEEKSTQVAVDALDITGDRVVVPTYFIVEYPNGEKKALHHVLDAKEISDVIRQMRLHEEEEPKSGNTDRSSGLSSVGFILIVLMSLFTLLTCTIAIGIF